MILIRVVTCFSLVLVLGCSSKLVSYNNPKSNYKSFETYRIVNPKLGNKSPDETKGTYNMIEANIAKEMTKRNYTQSTIQPDLILRYELTSSTRVENTTNQATFRPTWIKTKTIHEAILLLELTDKNRKLVWQGSYDLKNERSEKRIIKVIDNAISKIFTTYPYEALRANPNEALTTK